MTYTIRLVNCAFYAHHGVLAEEEKLGQRFFVDAEFAVEAPNALLKDEIEGTLDYGAAFAVIAEVVTGRRFALIEALAYAVGQAVLERFPSAKSARITVRKPNAPIVGVLDHAEVTVSLP